MIIERQAARALLLTSANEILLMKIQPPDCNESFWIAPGGGLEVGEDTERALRRELNEELGLGHFELGPLVWRRRHTFNWDGRRICQREHYHVVHVDRFEPRMSDQEEARILDQFRWWRISELAHAREPLTPILLADIITRYLTAGPSTTLPEWEVLID
jgi:8-oxo-dGTP pyrophosphatase MutT (NUDIX family)